MEQVVIYWQDFWPDSESYKLFLKNSSFIKRRLKCPGSLKEENFIAAKDQNHCYGV
jgi:hypothetical protein